MFKLPKSVPMRRGKPESWRGLRDAGRDVVGHVAGHAGQLAGGVEVADERHVRVGRRRRARSSSSCPAEQQHLGDPDLGAGQPDALGADPEVARPGWSSVDRHLLGEERVGDVEHLRREDRRPAARTGRGPVRAALRTVAVEATISGRTGLPSAVSHDDSVSTATSNSPTAVPSAPVIRCSSSWMIRSGGRSRPTGCTVAAGVPSRRRCAPS